MNKYVRGQTLLINKNGIGPPPSLCCIGKICDLKIYRENANNFKLDNILLENDLLYVTFCEDGKFDILVYSAQLNITFKADYIILDYNTSPFNGNSVRVWNEVNL